ncbi:hypothetical protein ACFQ1Q_00055 [Winogradskyella litorisediminis]|uniref:Secreted protein n=1 Tax=Winogradskyella litorisediminis TaxID=1156618 RepID=A0ABW3N3Z7_9FLAO
MKKIALILIFLFLYKINYSQNSNDYKIDKNVKITFINLKIKSSIVYTKNGKQLIGISMNRRNDSISYLWKIYDKTDTIGDSKLSLKELYLKNSIEIPTSEFDKIVSKLKEINIDKVNNSSSYGIMDGKMYYLTFSGNGYQMSASAHSPEIQTKDRELEEYLNLCNQIWNLYK